MPRHKTGPLSLFWKRRLTSKNKPELAKGLRKISFCAETSASPSPLLKEVR